MEQIPIVKEKRVEVFIQQRRFGPLTEQIIQRRLTQLQEMDAIEVVIQGPWSQVDGGGLQSCENRLRKLTSKVFKFLMFCRELTCQSIKTVLQQESYVCWFASWYKDLLGTSRFAGSPLCKSECDGGVQVVGKRCKTFATFGAEQCSVKKEKRP